MHERYAEIVCPPSQPGVGGKEYRVKSVDFDALAELGPQMRASDRAEILREFDSYGRKIAVKKDKFAEIIDEWPTPDAYLTMRLNSEMTYPDPDRAQQYGENVIREALMDAFPGVTDEEMEQGKQDYGSLTRWLKHEYESGRLAGPEDRDKLFADLYKTAHELTDESSEAVIRDTIAGVVFDMEEPWVFLQIINGGFAVYVGEYMMIEGMARSNLLADYTEDVLHSAWDVCADPGIIFLDAVLGGEVSTTYEPHSRPNPMKAQSDYEPTDIPELQESGNWVAQTKYDGTRVTVHHTGDGDPRVYFGCGGKDITAVMPEMNDLPLPEHSYIFDAEATPYDPETGEVLSFQHILQRTSRSPDSDLDGSETPDVEVRFKFFDCMYWYDEDIRHRQFEDRYAIVEKTFPPMFVARQGTDLAATFHRSIDAGHEGVILKRLGHEFQLNNRSDDWQKWKSQPMEIDVVVTDANRGGGRISDRVGALTIALEHEEGLVNVGAVGTGFSDEERLDLWRKWESGELKGSVIQVTFEEFQNGKDDSDLDTSWALRFPSYDHRRPEGEVDTLRHAAVLDSKEDEFDEWVGTAGKKIRGDYDHMS